MHPLNRHSLRTLPLTGAVMLAVAPAIAADVTPERLANPEPQNWLMNHRTYDAQRYSPLERINKDNVKNLKLAYSVALGGTSVNENLQATPLAEDGYLYIVDLWGIVYKIDARSGDVGRIVWRMDPNQQKFPLSNRGAALWGNLVISTANYPARVIATDKETGKMVWETNLSDQPDVQLTAAPLVVRTRSLWAPPAAIAACATGSPGLMRRPASFCGDNTSSRRPASLAARPGRTRTTPGRPAAAPCGSPAPTTSHQTR